WRAHAMVDGAIISEGGEPQSSAPPAETSWLSAKTITFLLGGLGIGGSVGLTKFSWSDLEKPPLPDVTSQWVLLIIVAVVGWLVGLAHAFYRNNWSLILPVISRDGGRFRVRSFGFLRNVFMASLVSVATTWIAFSNVAVENPVPPAKGEAQAARAPQTLLT